MILLVSVAGPSHMLFVSWILGFCHVVLSARDTFPSPFTFSNYFHLSRTSSRPTSFMLTSLNAMPRKRSYSPLTQPSIPKKKKAYYLPCHTYGAYGVFYPSSIFLIYFPRICDIWSLFHPYDSFILIFYQVSKRLALCT